MYAPASQGRTAPRLVLAIVASIVAALVVVGIAVVVSLSRDAAWQAPEFPSLADDPDPTITGTVAYLDDATGCVDVVAAGGGPSTEVFCIPDEPVERSQQLGKPLGPQLVWLEDGRLEVTMFRMTDPPGPLFDPGRQWVVDVRTGEVEQVPDAEAPGAANRRTHPTTNERGETVLLDRGPRSVEVSLRTDGGTRTLLAVDGIPEGAYWVSAAFWAPSGDWIAVDDGRILVVVPGAEEEVRVLTDASSQGRFEGELSRFAVSDQEARPDQGSVRGRVRGGSGVDQGHMGRKSGVGAYRRVVGSTHTN